MTVPPQPQTPHRAERLNARAAVIVSVAVLLSRLLGVARQQIFAALFGGGRIMDAFTVAFRTPNLLRDLFAEGALSTAFITVFSRTITTDGDRCAWDLANRIATLAIIFLSVIVLAGIGLAPWIVKLLAPGFDPDKAALTVLLTRIMYPFILLVSLAALAMGLLNAKNVFGMPALASSFFNLGSIAGGVLIGWWLDPAFGRQAIVGLALGTLIGGALQLFVQVPSLRRVGYRFRPDFSWRDSKVREVFALMGPSVVAASSTQVNVMVNTIFASHLADGAVFWLATAFSLVQLPLGLFGVALGTVALPLLARLVARNDLVTFREELARGLRLGFLLTIPSTLGLMLLAEPIISVLYQHGRFTAEQTVQTAAALRLYSIGLAGYAGLKVLVNSFYALGRRLTPMYVSFAAIGVNAFLGWLFIFHFALGHRGLALATGCIATGNFLALYVLMHRQLGRFETRALATLLGKVAIAGAGLAAVAWAGNRLLLAEWQTMPFLPKLVALMATITAAALVFFAIAFMLRVAELAPIAAAVRRRLARRRGG